MKKLLLFFHFSFFVLFSQAQTNYLPFPNSNAGWEVDFWIGPGYPHQYHYYFMNRQNNDTIINSTLYGKLNVAWGSTSSYNYTGALREDNGRVFYFPKDSLTEFPLYDFNLNVNDTFNSFYSNGPLGDGLWSGKVLSKDSVLISNRYQRILEVECTAYNGQPWSGRGYWKEKSGGDAGLLEGIRMASVSGSTMLTCMNSNDTLWYFYSTSPGTPGNCAFFTEQVSELPGNRISIYPNPLNHLSILQINARVNNAEVIIYDMLGHEMMRKKMNGDKMEIERGNLVSGVYFVKVVDFNNAQSKASYREWVEKIIVE